MKSHLRRVPMATRTSHPRSVIVKRAELDAYIARRRRGKLIAAIIVVCSVIAMLYTFLRLLGVIK